MADRGPRGHDVPVSASPFHKTDVAPPTADGSRSRARGAGQFPSPAAARQPRRSWRDPRLLVGLAIVAACVLAGARLLAGADETVAVWTLRADLPAGSPVGEADLQSARLRFATEETAARYLPASGPIPEGMVLLRDLGAGELVPRSALGAEETRGLAEVPLSLASELVPAGLRPGELVDVWVTPPQRAGAETEAVRVLEEVRVVAAPRDSSALGPATTRQVVVGVPEDDEDLLARALGQLADGAVVLVRRG